MKFIFVIAFLLFSATNAFAQKPDLSTLPDITIQTLDNTSTKLNSQLAATGYTLLILSPESYSPDISRETELQMAKLPLKIICVYTQLPKELLVGKNTGQHMKDIRKAVERLKFTENVYYDINKELETAADNYLFTWLLNENKTVIYSSKGLISPKYVPDLLLKIDSVKGNKFSLTQLQFIDKFLDNCKPMFVKRDTLFFENGYGFDGKKIFDARQQSPYIITKDRFGNDTIKTVKKIDPPVFTEVYATANCFYNNELYYTDFDESSDVGEYQSKIYKLVNLVPYKHLILKFKGVAGGDLTPFQDGILFSYKPFGKSKFELWKTDGTENSATQVNDGAAGRMMAHNSAFVFTSDSGRISSISMKDGMVTRLISDCRGCTGKVADESLYLLQTFQKADKKMATKIWKTDGTPTGTQLVVKDSTRFYYEAVGLKNKIFLIGGDSIYLLDKVSMGGVKAIVPRESKSYERGSFFTFNGLLYSKVYDKGVVFWRTDGTPGKMQQINLIKNRVKELSKFIEYNGYMYFSGLDATTNKKGLWRTDFDTLTYINDFLE